MRTTYDSEHDFSFSIASAPPGLGNYGRKSRPFDSKYGLVYKKIVEQAKIDNSYIVVTCPSKKVVHLLFSAIANQNKIGRRYEREGLKRKLPPIECMSHNLDVFARVVPSTKKEARDAQK